MGKVNMENRFYLFDDTTLGQWYVNPVAHNFYTATNSSPDGTLTPVFKVTQNGLIVTGFVTHTLLPSFMAQVVNIAYAANTVVGLKPTQVDHDTLGNYSATTGRFTAPVAGIYQINAAVTPTMFDATQTRDMQLMLYKNDVMFLRIRTNGKDLVTSNSDYVQLSMPFHFKLAVNDYLDIRFLLM